MPTPPIFTIDSNVAGDTWCADIEIVDDTVRESVREDFTVSLMALDVRVTISLQRGSATVTIVDDDGGE